VIGLSHVSAKEKPTESKKLSLEELKAHAESILEYCMEKDIARVKRDDKVKKIIEELSEYLDRKCACIKSWHAR
jgi:hypothetical protein